MAENENVSMTDRITALAGTLGKSEESQGLRMLCEAARVELEGRLRPGVTPEDCGEAFPLAAAWMALAGKEALDDGVESLKAGDVTIRRSESRFRQRALKLQAEQVMKPYLRDEGFAFRGMKG